MTMTKLQTIIAIVLLIGGGYLAGMVTAPIPENCVLVEFLG